MKKEKEALQKQLDAVNAEKLGHTGTISTKFQEDIAGEVLKVQAQVIGDE